MKNDENSSTSASSGAASDSLGMSCSPVKCCPDNTLCPRSAPAEKQLKVRSQMIMLNLPESALGKMPDTAKGSNQKTPVPFSSPRLFFAFQSEQI